MSNPIELQGIDHIVLRSDDVPAMLRFYQQVLGATLERSLEDLGLHQLRAGSSLIDIVDCAKELGAKGGAAPEGKAANMDHFCLTLNTWDERILRDWLQQHGVASSDVARRYGAQGFGPSLYIQDPQGNTIELKQRQRAPPPIQQ
jgi:glyoxylase I family protein